MRIGRDLKTLRLWHGPCSFSAQHQFLDPDHEFTINLAGKQSFRGNEYFFFDEGKLN